MKKFALVFVVFLSLILLCGCSQSGGYTYVPAKQYVRFMANCPAQEVTLSSNFHAVASNLMVFRQEVVAGEKISAPDIQLQRDGYEFVGWGQSVDGDLWDFDKQVNGGMTLFAVWQRSQTQTEKDDFTEVKLQFQQKVVSSQSEMLVVEAVTNCPVEGNNVNLTTAAINLLKRNAQDAHQYLTYTVNDVTANVVATFVDGKLTVTCSVGYSNQVVEINVRDVTSKLVVNNSTYETKAQKYEAQTEIDNYGVVLAGSSSMENWSTSTEDMQPLTTVNVGIGGTTVDMWRDCLAERLIFPYSPRAVVIYVGINNIINSKDSGEVTAEKLVQLFEKIHERLPNATIHFVLMNLVPGYLQYQNQIETANGLVKEFAAGKDWLNLIDAGKSLVKESGKPNTAYFLSDGLHMSKSGYVLWGAEVKNSVIAFEKELYK